MGKLFLGILKCVDVLRDALGHGIEPNHLGGEVDEVNGTMKAVTVVIEVAEEWATVTELQNMCVF